MQKLLLTCVLCLCTCMCADAYDFEVKGLYYDLISASEKTCKLVGCSEAVTDLDIPATVTYSGFTLSVIDIEGEYGQEQSNLTSVSFATSAITDIKNCTWGSSIKSLNIGNHITEIPYRAFYNCPLDTAIIPPSITSLGQSCFYSAKNIVIQDCPVTLILKDGNIYGSYPIINNPKYTYIGRPIRGFLSMERDYIKQTCLTGTLNDVKYGAYCSGTLCPSYYIPLHGYRDNLTLSDVETFRVPKNITSITYTSPLSYSKMHIGTDLAVKKLVIDDAGSPLALDGFSFNSIENLYLGRDIDQQLSVSDKLTIGDSVTTLRLGVVRLSTLTLGNNVRYVYGLSNSANLQTIKFNNRLETIEDGAFSNCTKLKSINLTCTAIKSAAFSDCDAMETISVNCVLIGDKAFNNCTSLNSLSLGPKTTSIGSSFDGCKKLQQIECFATTPPSCSSNAFGATNKFTCTLYVPKGCKHLYEKADGWKKFLHIVEGRIPGRK